MKKKGGFIKWGLLGAFVMAGGVAATSAPGFVEGFLPVVNTVKPIKAEYSEGVSGIGLIAAMEIEGEQVWLVNIAVNEADISKVSDGQQANLKGPAFKDDLYKATVVNISDTARQTATGVSIETVVDVTLKIENPDENLRHGYTAKAEILTGSPREMLTVPYNSVAQDENGEYLYVLQNHRAVRRSIKTGVELETGIEALDGVNEKDEIILNPDAVMKDSLVKKAE